MATNIQLRNVPDELHRTLKARAALAGMSLSDYLIDYVRRLAERPTPDEMRERLARREPVRVSEPAADVLRRERDGTEPGL
jgi:antitoxin FitA